MADDDKLIPAPDSLKEAFSAVFHSSHADLYDLPFNKANGKTFAVQIAKSLGRSMAESSRGITVGKKRHPFDYNKISNFMTANVHHSRCIQTKVASTIGLGFVTPESKQRRLTGDTSIRPVEQSRVDEILNPFCYKSFHHTLTAVVDDFEQRGGGLIEVKREEPSQDAKIVGLHHIPATEANVYVEKRDGTYHWRISSFDDTEKYFPVFGDLEGFISRYPNYPKDQLSEVIYIPQPSSVSRWYGYPDWLACVANIELKQCMMQERFDFFLNRGVPEFFLFITGAMLHKDQWKQVEDAMMANIGLGNSHKSLALNLPQKDIVVDLQKLSTDSKENEFGANSETIAQEIVSAHGVPPLLANIQIPGKAGAANELPNSLQAFQILVVGPRQRNIQLMLWTTLGNKDLNGGLDFSYDDFAFNQITDNFNLGTAVKGEDPTAPGMGSGPGKASSVADTVARMKTPLAAAGGRDLSQGLKQ